MDRELLLILCVMFSANIKYYRSPNPSNHKEIEMESDQLFTFAEIQNPRSH